MRTKPAQTSPTVTGHDIATLAIYPNMSVGDNDVARLCIYKKLKE